MADLVVQVDRGGDTLANWKLGKRFEGGEIHLLSLAVGEGIEIVSDELLSLFTVIALTRLFADPATADEGRQGNRNAEIRHLRIGRATFLEVEGDVAHDVEPN